MTEQQNEEQNKADALTNAIYSITDNADTPPDVKKFLLDYLFEKNGISVEFSEVETKQDERIERDEDIRLTPERASELVKWILTDRAGIFSADAFDDRAKQALLVLLSAMAYDDDATNRENILIDVRQEVFGYSFACDNAVNQFIQNGFEAFRSGCWQAEIKETM
jgi:hypothetical protein